MSSTHTTKQTARYTAQKNAFWRAALLRKTVRFLVLVLSLNAVNGFAACCIDTNTNSDNIKIAQNDNAENAMPCHQNTAIDNSMTNSNDSIDNNSINSEKNITTMDKCCNACAFTALPTTVLKSHTKQAPAHIANMLSEFVSIAKNPLLRPPIA